MEKYGKENIIVILGTPDAETSQMYAETLTHGDPSWMGPLAGVALGLPVFHVMEPAIKEQIAPEIFQEHLELLEIAFDVDAITSALNGVREK